MFAVRPKLMTLEVPVLAVKCKQRNYVIKILTARQKHRSLGIAANCHVGFTDLYRVQKCSEMVGGVEAKSLESHIQVQRPERNVSCLSHVINILLTRLLLFLCVNPGVFIDLSSSLVGQPACKNEYLCSSIEPLEQIQRSNLAYRTEGSVGQPFRTELNECVYQSNHWSKSRIQI